MSAIGPLELLDKAIGSSLWIVLKGGEQYSDCSTGASELAC